MHTSGNSSIDTSLIRDIYCGPEVLFETCVAVKFVDDDDDDLQKCHDSAAQSSSQPEKISRRWTCDQKAEG